MALTFYRELRSPRPTKHQQCICRTPSGHCLWIGSIIAGRSSEAQRHRRLLPPELRRYSEFARVDRDVAAVGEHIFGGLFCHPFNSPPAGRPKHRDGLFLIADLIGDSQSVPCVSADRKPMSSNPGDESGESVSHRSYEHQTSAHATMTQAVRVKHVYHVPTRMAVASASDIELDDEGRV